MINRQELSRELYNSLTDELLVTGIGNATNDAYAARDRAQNFYMRGSMGCAIPIAFGLAHTRPNDRVVCVEGDGSVLMNMNGLATVGRYAPKNLACIILDNGLYQITGGQATHTGNGIDLSKVAGACGFNAAAVDTLPDFKAQLREVLVTPGPHFLLARIDRSLADPKGYYPRRPPLIKYRFMGKIGTMEDPKRLVWD